MMEKGLEELGEGDEHVRDLARRLREVLSRCREERSTEKTAEVVEEPKGRGLTLVNSRRSTDEQDETEKEEPRSGKNPSPAVS